MSNGERPDEVKRRVCVDCGVKLYNANRARKHETKTQHKTVIDALAERAVEKYLRRQTPTYLDRLEAKDRGING